MDNENKDLQGSETEMTPEEKVQVDISAKISEAAEPLKDEINEANQGEVALDDETVESGAADETAVLNEDGTPIESDEMIDVKPEPKKVTLKLSSFVTSTVAAVLVGALLMFAVYQMPAANKALPGGSQKAAMIEESDGSKVIATVNDAPHDYLWNDKSPLWFRPQYETREMFRADTYKQVVGHTPVEKIFEKDGIISTDVFSTYRDGRQIGESAMIVIDSETGEYEKIEVMGKLGV